MLLPHEAPQIWLEQQVLAKREKRANASGSTGVGSGSPVRMCTIYVIRCTVGDRMVTVDLLSGMERLIHPFHLEAVKQGEDGMGLVEIIVDCERIR